MRTFSSSVCKLHFFVAAACGLAFLLAGSAPAGGANRLIVGSTYGDFIAEYDLTTGGFVGMLVPAGSGGLDEPIGMALGPDGALYVSSAWTGSVLKYDAHTGAFLGTFADGFNLPTGLTYADGSFYVPDRSAKRIHHLDALTGAVTGQTPVMDNATIWWPWDAHLNGHGQLLMANHERTNIIAWNATTLAFEGVFASLSGASRAGNMTIGPDGNVYITGHDSYVYRFDGQTGADLGAIHIPGLTQSSGLTFALDGDLYVTGHREPGVYHLDGDTFALQRVIDTSAIGLEGSWTLLVIPEPASITLLGIGALAIGRRGRARR
ncbi:MAG: PEP-CTERM sorting domain-containing protein [Phycisphaeraceae bacterium]|nr:PEP-CTERM sorting domain-containing protein [Phycisphaeraceae bacterium]